MITRIQIAPERPGAKQLITNIKKYIKFINTEIQQSRVVTLFLKLTFDRLKVSKF